MSTAFQLLLHYLTQLASLFWSPLNRLFLMENQPPNSPTFDAQADGAGNCSPNLPQDSEAAALNFDGKCFLFFCLLCFQRLTMIDSTF